MRVLKFIGCWILVAAFVWLCEATHGMAAFILLVLALITVVSAIIWDIVK